MLRGQIFPDPVTHGTVFSSNREDAIAIRDTFVGRVVRGIFEQFDRNPDQGIGLLNPDRIGWTKPDQPTHVQNARLLIHHNSPFASKRASSLTIARNRRRGTLTYAENSSMLTRSPSGFEYGAIVSCTIVPRACPPQNREA